MATESNDADRFWASAEPALLAAKSGCSRCTWGAGASGAPGVTSAAATERRRRLG
jgi:hypothetical protein